MEREPKSSYEIDERAAEAQMLLAHPLIEEAMVTLHRDFMAVLIQSTLGSQEAMTAQAGLQVIQGIRAHLQSLITDKKVNDKRERSNGR